MSHDPDGCFARRAKIRAQDRFIEPISRGEICYAARRCHNDNIPPHVCPFFLLDLSSRSSFFVALIFFSHLHPTSFTGRFLMSLVVGRYRLQKETRENFFIELSALLLKSCSNSHGSSCKKLCFLSRVIHYFFYSTFKIDFFTIKIEQIWNKIFDRHRDLKNDTYISIHLK